MLVERTAESDPLLNLKLKVKIKRRTVSPI